MFKKFAYAAVTVSLFSFGSAFAMHHGGSSFPWDNSLDRAVYVDMTDTPVAFPEDNSRD